MLSLHSPQVVQETILRWKKNGHSIAIVPTMGSLHEGHLSLVKMAKGLASKVAVSIFVNPLQFGPSEDFDAYPRSLSVDTALLEDLHVDLLFAPDVKDLYPSGFSTSVNVSGITRHLCGSSRAGHFEGVATVCLKLFHITQADTAVFGEKDFQQLCVIEKMVGDLNLPLQIVGHPIFREEDGLALSSRNRYLSEEERVRALSLSAGLRRASESLEENPSMTVGDILNIAKNCMTSAPVDIEYLTITSERDLIPVLESVKVNEIDQPRLFVAARVGRTRLIDNLALQTRQE